MQKIFPLSVLLFVSINVLSQDVSQIVTEKSVTRIIRTLSSDAMMGRSATAPAQIEPATAFIETEFRKIGLKPLQGLSGFRQGFSKDWVTPGAVVVMVDNRLVPAGDVAVVSDNQQISISGSDQFATIQYDSTIPNKRQHFFRSAFAFMSDTISKVMVIARDYQEHFMEFKQYMEKHFVSDRKHDKVYIVVGDPSIRSYSVKVTQKIESIRMNNVVGVIPGKTKPGELVLFSAHYDHIGIINAVEGDSIANGADDDASGVTAVIELARYFQAAKNNDRTLIFVAFTAEEIGGYGSRYFSEQLDPEKIVAMFNIEMIGKPSKWGLNAAFITGYERSSLGPIMEKNVRGTGFSFKPDPYIEQNLFYRSDNATLARLGVPAHTISTDQIDTDKYYHTVDDEFETINTSNITSAIRAIVKGSRTIVNGTETPSRIEKATVQ